MPSRSEYGAFSALRGQDVGMAGVLVGGYEKAPVTWPGKGSTSRACTPVPSSIVLSRTRRAHPIGEVPVE